MKPYACAVLFGLGLAACEAEDPVEAPRSLSFERVPIPCVQTDEKLATVFDDAEAWAEFWPSHTGCRDAQGQLLAPPTIDFTSHVLAAIWLEAECKYSGCPDPPLQLIERIDHTSKRAVIRTQRIDPSQLGLCQACFQPSEFIAVARADLGSASLEFD